ncbi:MAG: glycoside hydrolase family 44 protein [Opitutus sp.]
MLLPTPLARAVTFVAVSVASLSAFAEDIHVVINSTQERRAVSPYLYGRNGGLSHDPLQPLTAAEWQFLRDSGVRMLREHGGNNGTKYNWQKKLSSHPDWYNNVYANDWDFAQSSLGQNLPGVQVMWCFQLLGKVADNTQHNFDDWSYNRSQWWAGTAQNLAGGGVPSASGGKALKEGDTSLYLADTSAVTSTAILDHWTNTAGLNLDRSRFQYWNMDNEPEIWNGTHDDVMPTQLSAEAFMQRYFDYAKQARSRYPQIKLAGPLPANEWQWFNWGTGLITASDGKKYPWLEFFIKRVSEEQTRTGIRLLDVLDLHYYPGPSDPATVVQLHRTFFDTTYVNPDANAVHSINGSWDASITQEYIFGRCQQWLDKYLGANHGVTLGLTETAIQLTNAPVASVWYASMLGEFMKHGVEVFAPWSWQPGMWEVLHLYSRYNNTLSVSGVSDDETTVSAYPTLDSVTGNATVVLVNRSLSQTKSTAVSFTGLSVPDRGYSTLQLSSLPASETFVSHTANALKQGTVTVSNNRFSISLPPLSVTSVQLQSQAVVTPTPPPSTGSRLTNLSVRARSGGGDDVMIVGLVLGGSGSKRVLLRGIGPTLKKLGVPTALTDSSVTLYDSKGNQISTNDDWGSDPASASTLGSMFSDLGAFSLDASSADAALAPVLSPGVYTFHVRGKSGTQGVALGEIYDADSAGSAKLLNVAARTGVGVDADVLIAGFVIAGSDAKAVLIRAVGPGLTRFGVTGVLADPVLRIYRNGVELPIFQNDDWGTAANASQVVTTGERIGAASLANGSKDAALLLTLPPGVYSAIVSGAGNSTGVGMVEVYDAD